MAWFDLSTSALFRTGGFGRRAFRLYTGRISHVFLVWNLFLAYLPLLFAWLAYKSHKRPLLIVGLAFLWLLFFPNAPYLVTDLIHLRHVDTGSTLVRSDSPL